MLSTLAELVLIRQYASLFVLLSPGGILFESGAAKADVAGIIEESDGTPATGVMVFFIPGQKEQLTFSFSNGQPELGDRSIVANKGFLSIERVKWSMHTTGADGKFTFKSRSTSFLIIAANNSGVALTTQKSHASLMRLTKWRTIRGRLSLDGEHAKAGEQMIVECPWVLDDENAKIMFQDICETDTEEKFMFPRVPGKGARVARAHGLSPAEQTDAEWVDFNDDAEITLELNRNSRPVTGKMQLPNQLSWSQASGSLELISDGPTERQTDVDPGTWWRPETIKIWRSARTYPFAIEKDGSFHIGDVRPGTYSLMLRAVTTNPATLAGLTKQLDVEPDENYRKIDLETLQLYAPHELRIGMPAPNFVANTLDNNLFELAGKRKQFVLLEFWGTWCTPCREEIGTIRKLHEKFGRIDRLVIVDLAINDNQKRVSDFVRKNDMPWTHIVLNDRYSTPIPSQFGLNGIPHSFLISPDGTLIFSGRGRDLLEATENALSQFDK